MRSNRETFEHVDVVRYYGSDQSLQAPEQRILDLLRPQLAEMSMLDIGVGTGRTTAFFAPLVKRYLGVDYAAAMIERCQRRFAAQEGRLEFGVADVRDLSHFADKSFDLVMFSYNGLDYISHEDRLLGLGEMARVLRSGGTFVLSSHNILSLPALFDFGRGIQLHPIRTLEHLLAQFRLRRALPLSTLPQVMARPWAIVNDGSHEFRVKTYYILPSAQVKQLEPWFRDVQTFRLRGNGEQLPDFAAMDACTDPWIYFVCTRR